MQPPFEFAVENGQATLTRYNGDDDEEVAIPGAFQGLPVTRIGDAAFQYCVSLRSVVIPDSVTAIGPYAFFACSGLSNVVFGAGVVTIGEGAFRSCDRLITVVLPDSVVEIAPSAFRNCALSSLSLGGNLARIGDSAFAYCYSLKNLVLPPGVGRVDSQAFAWCTGLTNICFGRVSTLGERAFMWCSALKHVVLPPNVAMIETGVFSCCGSLSAIDVDDRNGSYRSVDGVLFDKSQATLVQYPAGRAGPYAVPRGVRRIEIDAFYGCAALTEIALPAGTLSIDHRAFFNCRALRAVTAPASLRSFGVQAFLGCGNLRGLYFEADAVGPENGSVGSNLFQGATNVVVYCRPGTRGWGPSFAGRPTALWHLSQPAILSFGPDFGVQSNRFGFIVSWATNALVVVETAASLAPANWTSAATNTISVGPDPLSGGWFFFSDPQSVLQPGRFYRVRSLLQHSHRDRKSGL